ncbi:hypothetical protein ABVK25_001877 [Lepraria finkii]|uniref:Uncharacterized protein n=1 Tax=Lepraria finkii TaxID=1340010 RepID=A0ABR4BKB5_9LECA
MDNDNVKMVEDEMDPLKKSLENHDDNKASLTASDKLREVIGPLIKLTLVERANAIVKSVEQQVANLDDAKKKDQKEALTSKMTPLRQLLKESPDDKEKVEKAMEELETISVEIRERDTVIVREEDVVESGEKDNRT